MKALSSPNPAAALLSASILLVFLLTPVGTARAQAEPTALVDQQHCMFCHTRDAPFLAPSFQQIAARYRGVPDAHSMLEQKLRVGGAAHWGDTPMPLPPERGGPITADDAHALIDWVLSQ